MYLFYIDETGNLDTKSFGVANSESGKDWLYVLTALGVFEHKWRDYYNPIICCKKKLLQIHGKREITLDRCEIKSNWLRIPKERQKHPFLSILTDEEMKSLVECYYSQLDKVNAVLISVVVDKRYLLEHFDSSKLHRKAWELLCERIENLMRERHGKHKAVLIVDDISKQVNMSLARKHAYFLDSGTSANCYFKHIVEMPLFTRSELSEGIQLADLCSYSIYHAFKYQKAEYGYFRKILPRIYRSRHTGINKLDGLKIFPENSPLLKWWQDQKITEIGI